MAQTIAFRRVLPSSYGPSGVYVISRLGGQPRFVYGPANIFAPAEGSFSPDGGRLATIDGSRQLVVADLSSGQVNRPCFTSAAVHSADWSPDGAHILLSRFSSGQTPVDSVGLFLLDVSTGDLRAFKSGDTMAVYAERVRWEAGGKRFAMIRVNPPHETISVMNADGTGLRDVLPPALPPSWLAWYTPVQGAGARLIFYPALTSTRIAVVNVDGTGFEAMMRYWLGNAVMSSDGSEYVTQDVEPAGVHYVLGVGNVSSTTPYDRRQLTEFSPP